MLGLLIGLAVVALLLAAAVVPLAYVLRPLLEGLAVLAVAAAGLWLIITAPFRGGQ